MWKLRVRALIFQRKTSETVETVGKRNKGRNKRVRSLRVRRARPWGAGAFKCRLSPYYTPIYKKADGMKTIDQLKMTCAAAVLLDDVRPGGEEWESMRKEWLAAFRWWGHGEGECPAGYLVETDEDA